MKYVLNFSACTDTGKKYKHNEDFYVLPVPDEKYKITMEKIRNKGSLFVLCDGMGGAKSGEVASQMTAAWTIKDFYSDNFKKTVLEKLKTIISNVNSKIYSLSSDHEEYKGMGTTIALCHIEDSFYSVCSLGDSRVYLLRNKKLIQLTQDHSEVWNLYKSGALTKEELRHHPRNNVLLSAVGAKEKLDENEICSVSGRLEKNDIFMLCSDGLSDMVCEDDIKKIILTFSSLEKKCEKLVVQANKNGGKDNITVVLIKVETRTNILGRFLKNR